MRGQLSETDVATPNLMWKIRCQLFAYLTLTEQALVRDEVLRSERLFGDPMRNVLLASLIAIGSLVFFEVGPLAGDYGEGHSEPGLASDDGRDSGAVSEGSNIKQVPIDAAARGAGDKVAAIDSGGGAFRARLARLQDWIFVLPLMTLSFWLARRRGRNGWRWFFGTLVLYLLPAESNLIVTNLGTFYLLVSTPLPGSPLAVKRRHRQKEGSSEQIVDQSLLDERRARLAAKRRHGQKEGSSEQRVDLSLLHELRAINGIGRHTAEKIAAEFPTREALRQASMPQLEAIHGVGEKGASLIRAQFH
jgi:hypothetical protein